MSAEQATKLLSGLIYERLASCIDSDALIELEHEIAFAMHECGFEMTECIEGALGMVQAALVRFANNPKGWSPPQPLVDDDCALCQDSKWEVEGEAAPQRKRAR